MRRKSIPWALTRKDDGALPVAGAALATAKGTSGVGPAGGAKKSTAATSEALEREAYAGQGAMRKATAKREAWNRVETPPREGGRVLDEP